jgi:glycosyltransferase involved in cell wall biosynthesis
MLQHKRVCLISGGIDSHNLRLQPWRYLHEISVQLARQGHAVTVITDAGELDEPGEGITLQRLANVNHYRWQPNPDLQQAIKESKPDVILWHLGLPSFVHQELDLGIKAQIVAIYPGLFYHAKDFRRLGVRSLIQSLDMIKIHLANACIPRQAIRNGVNDGKIERLVVLSDTTRRESIAAGVHQERVIAIAPGIDAHWLHPPAENGKVHEFRSSLAYRAEDTVILYFGSPHPLRGMHDLLQAFEAAHVHDESLHLLILSRRRADELVREDARLRDLLERSKVRDYIRVVSGYQDLAQLIQYVAVSDAVALPFQLVPSDGPLSIFEAQAQGKPVITTRVGSLPEMVSGGEHFLAEPADVRSLAEALLGASKHKRMKKEPGKPVQLRTWEQVGEVWSHFIQSL